MQAETMRTRARPTTDAALRLTRQAWSSLERARALITTSAAMDNAQRRTDAEVQLTAAMHLVTGVGEQLRRENRP